MFLIKMYPACTQHFCSYRMENAIQQNVLAMPNPIKEYLFHQKIVQVVSIHHRIIRLVFNNCILRFFLSLFVSLSYELKMISKFYYTVVYNRK